MKTLFIFIAIFVASAFPWNKDDGVSMSDIKEDLAFMEGEDDLAMFNPVFGIGKTGLCRRRCRYQYQNSYPSYRICVTKYC